MGDTAATAVISLETAFQWARSGRQSDKVYRFLFLHPEEFFTVPIQRTWSIAHQITYHGNVYLLKRILALFYDKLIDIRTKSKDHKTLLDVATDRKDIYPDMYTYVERLFRRDELIQLARQSQWQRIDELLKIDPELANEKPPYSAFFLLHYLVQNGTLEILERFLRNYEIDSNILSTDLETPLDLARRLKKFDMCTKLERTTKDLPNSDLFRHCLSVSSNVQSTVPYPINDPFPRPIDFQNNSLILTDEGNYHIEKHLLFSTKPFEIAIPEQIIHPVSTVINEETSNPDPKNQDNLVNHTPIPSSRDSNLMRNLRCMLTKEIFRDPVIASDGQTYEREAIIAWLKLYPCSPVTGMPMEAVFEDNVELRNIIQSMQK